MSFDDLGFARQRRHGASCRRASGALFSPGTSAASSVPVMIAPTKKERTTCGSARRKLLLRLGAAPPGQAAHLKG
jgi:hypothetical protein